MKISARNVFRGKVTSLREGPISAEVEVTTANGDKIVATVTDGSVKALGIAAGKEAAAIVKAPWVVLVADAPEYRFTARNQWSGKVTRVSRGAINSLVELALPGGTSLQSVVTNAAVDELGLAAGVPVTALVKASHVLLGVSQ